MRDAITTCKSKNSTRKLITHENHIIPYENQTNMKIMKFHKRINTIMKIIEFSLVNHENHENPRIPYENHENY